VRWNTDEDDWGFEDDLTLADPRGSDEQAGERPQSPEPVIPSIPQARRGVRGARVVTLLSLAIVELVWLAAVGLLVWWLVGQNDGALGVLSRPT
jgi:hypothetical protein